MGVTIYGPEVREEILNRLASGETLRAICRSDGMPNPARVVQWCDEDEEFAKRYARARSMCLQVHEDELIAIADDSSEDWITRQREDGSEYTVLDQDHVQRARLRIDTRKWLMSKLRPDKYGDRQILAGDKDAPLGIEFVVSTVKRD